MISVLLGLRLGRWGVFGFSLAALLSIFVQTAGFYQIAGHTLAERLQFGASMAALEAQFVALFAPTIRPDTVEGFVEFRGFNPLMILFAVWALASASGFARGDETRGIVETELAAGTPRPVLLAARSGAFAIAVSVASIAAAAGFLIGVAANHDTVEARGLIEMTLLIAAVGMACYGLTLLVAQVVGARIATASAGALLVVLYLVNSLSRSFSWLSTWRWLSPFRYYDLSQPLPQGGYFDGRAFVILVAFGVVATLLAAVAFMRRDVGGSILRLPAISRRSTHDAAPKPWWRLPVVRGLYERRLGVLAWAAGTAALAAVFVALTRTLVQALLSVPTLLPYLSIFVHQQLYPAVLGYTWSNAAQLLFAALAITYVASWSAEDSDGRLEAVLANPTSRAAVVLERMGVLTVAAAIAAGASGLVLAYASHAQGIDLVPQRVAAASLMLVPFALVFAGAGAALAAWNPRAAVALLGALAFASYLDTELGTIYKLPLWLQDLSAFKLFGTPLVTGVDARNLALMLLLAIAGLGSSILLMQRRDVGR